LPLSCGGRCRCSVFGWSAKANVHSFCNLDESLFPCLPVTSLKAWLSHGWPVTAVPDHILSGLASPRGICRHGPLSKTLDKGLHEITDKPNKGKPLTK
jgi:hypothetical protein